MSTRGYAQAFKPDDNATMADVQDHAERLGLVVITDGNTFEYARPGQVPPGWRVFTMVQRSRPIPANEPQV